MFLMTLSQLTALADGESAGSPMLTSRPQPLNAALAELPALERFVLRSRAGLRRPAETVDAVALRLGLATAVVESVERRALLLLTDRLNDLDRSASKVSRRPLRRTDRTNGRTDYRTAVKRAPLLPPPRHYQKRRN